MRKETRKTIKEYVTSVQYQHNNIRKNMCDSLSNEIASLLEEDFGWTVYSPVLAPVNGVEHYVAVIKWDEIQPEDEIKYYVLDASRSQFEGEDEDMVLKPRTHSKITGFYDMIHLQQFK